MDLTGKTALVTGGSRGIGRATVLKLAEQGADVAINFAGNEAAARDVAAEVEKLGRRTMIIQADVSDADSAAEMIKEVVAKWERLDILVNNAGITRDNLLMRMKDDEWDDVLNINLKGVFNCTKAVTRQMMKQRSGTIINISSVVGLMGNAGQSNYAAAKAGIIGFSKSVARELAARGITVNVVAPGFIGTEMTAALGEDIQEQIMTQIPLGRLGQAGEVAKAIAFLASDDAAYITGQTINVDGGMVM